MRPIFHFHDYGRKDIWLARCGPAISGSLFFLGVLIRVSKINPFERVIFGMMCMGVLRISQELSIQSLLKEPS